MSTDTYVHAFDTWEAEHIVRFATTEMTMIERRGKPRTEEKRETQASKLNPLWQLDQQLKALGGTDDDAVQG
jgi:hypothetical protein